VRRGSENDAMGRRRLVNSRLRRLEATHWRHGKYAANRPMSDWVVTGGGGRYIRHRDASSLASGLQ
jgi:hypothetical protein